VRVLKKEFLEGMSFAQQKLNTGISDYKQPRPTRVPHPCALFERSDAEAPALRSLFAEGAAAPFTRVILSVAEPKVQFPDAAKNKSSASAAQKRNMWGGTEGRVC
jgi:hypothetical protein